MTKKLLACIALTCLMSLASAPRVYAEDPAPVDAARGAEAQPGEPDDPDASPYPPDGVTDPNATYPTDGSGGTDPGEAGAQVPDAPAAGGGNAPAAGSAKPY